MKKAKTVVVVAPFIPQVYVAEKLVSKLLSHLPQCRFLIHTLPQHKQQFEVNTQIDFVSDWGGVDVHLLIYIGHSFFLDDKLLRAIFQSEAEFKIWVNAHFETEDVSKWLNDEEARQALLKFDCIFYENERDAKFLSELGFSEPQMCLTQELKFDCASSNRVQQKIAAQLLDNFSFDRKDLVVFASVSCPEECEIFIDAMLALDQNKFAFLVAPRNMEHVEIMGDLLDRKGFDVMVSGEHISKPNAVLLLNQVGLLKGIYQFASVVVLGRTFLARSAGGSNMVEPAAAGVPMLVGPSISSENAQFELFDKQQALLQVKQSEGLSDAIAALDINQDHKRGLVRRAKAVYLKGLGATDQLILCLQKKKFI